MADRSERLELELERTLPAPREAVFAAFTEPEDLAKWWGPERFSIPSPDFNPGVGASYRIEMHPPEGDPFFVTGEFREVEVPSRLAFTFAWEPPDPHDVETLVELSFRDLGDSTEVSFVQGRFETEERRALHQGGWSDSFDKLERHLSNRRLPDLQRNRTLARGWGRRSWRS